MCFSHGFGVNLPSERMQNKIPSEESKSIDELLEYQDSISKHLLEIRSELVKHKNISGGGKVAAKVTQSVGIFYFPAAIAGGVMDAGFQVYESVIINNALQKLKEIAFDYEVKIRKVRKLYRRLINIAEEMSKVTEESVVICLDDIMASFCKLMGKSYVKSEQSMVINADKVLVENAAYAGYVITLCARDYLPTIDIKEFINNPLSVLSTTNECIVGSALGLFAMVYAGLSVSYALKELKTDNIAIQKVDCMLECLKQNAIILEENHES